MTGLVGVMRLTKSRTTPWTRVIRNRTEEVVLMSIPDGTVSKNGGVKTLAIRLEPVLHAQLSLIAQLSGSTITDEIRAAIESHIETVKANPDLAGRADGVLADIEREAAARRDAIATLFGGETNADPAEPTPTKPRGRRGGGTSPES